MKTLSRLSLSIIAFAVVLLVSCSKRSDGTILIGGTLPLSGEAAAWGQNTVNGIELAVEQINSGGGVLGRKIKVIYEDTKALPTEGVTAYRKLVSQDGVVAIIDDAVSSVTLAMAPLANKDKVVIVATGATAPKISQAGEYVFRIWNSDAYEGEVSAREAVSKLGYSKLAIAYVNNEYGIGLSDVFSNEVSKFGGAIVAKVSFDQNATDMRTQVSKITSKKPDAIYVVGYPKEVPIFLTQLRESGSVAKIIGTVAIEDPEIVSLAGDAAEGVIYPFPIPPGGERLEKFKAEYLAKWGSAPGLLSDVGYDAMMMISKAIESEGVATGDKIRTGLMKLKDYQGVSGTMTFDENGDVHKPMKMKTIQDGAFLWR